jgi:type 1 fimbria pilin
MINMKFKVSALLLAMSALSANADTDLGLITFDGAVSDTTCKVTTNNGLDAHNVTISMPVVTKNAVVDGTAATKEFELKLSECDPALTKAAISFTSQQFAELSTGTLKPDATVSGAAENVNIALFNNGNGTTEQVKIGDPADASQELDLSATNGGVFAYVAKYVPSADMDATNNPIIAGKVNTNATFTMTYE